MMRSAPVDGLSVMGGAVCDPALRFSAGDRTGSIRSECTSNKRRSGTIDEASLGKISPMCSTMILAEQIARWTRRWRWASSSRTWARRRSAQRQWNPRRQAERRGGRRLQWLTVIMVGSCICEAARRCRAGWRLTGTTEATEANRQVGQSVAQQQVRAAPKNSGVATWSLAGRCSARR